jgi:hypothetical protein
LQDILEWAQLAELTAAPNPTYRYAEIQVNQTTASRLIRWLNVSEEDARSLGVCVRDIVAREVAQLSDLMA